MQSRDRIITVIGGAGVIVALTLISRCGSENGLGEDVSIVAGDATRTRGPLPFAAPTAERRPRSYTGPSLDQLIADGRRRTVQTPFVEERQPPSGVEDARAMFGGDRVESTEGKFGAPRQPGRRIDNANLNNGASAFTNAPRQVGGGTNTGFVSPPFIPQPVIPAPDPGLNARPQAASVDAVDTGPAGAVTGRGEGGGAGAPSVLGTSIGGTGASGSTGATGGSSGGVNNLFTGIDLQTLLDSVGAGGGTGGSGTGGNGTGGGTTTPPANRVPTLAGLAAAPLVAATGAPFALTASGVADPDASVAGATGGAIARVQFFRDSNGNGTLEPTTDQLLGSDTTGSDGYLLLTSVNAAWGDGAVRFFARAVDSGAAFSTPATVLLTVNRAPAIGALAASAGVVASGGSVTLTATGILDPDPTGGAADRVQLFLDTNDDGAISDSDTLLATPNVAGGSASASVTLTGSPGQTVRVLARALDQLNAQSPTVAATSARINTPPSAGSLAVSNPAPSPGASVTLTASGLTDPDPLPGGLASVSFYLDADNSGAVSPADMLISTVTTTSGSVSAQAVIPASAAPTLRFLARPADALGALGNTVSVTVTTNRAPSVNSITASNAPRVLAPLTLTAAASDPDAPTDSVAAVRFFVDSNLNAVFDAGDEALGADNAPGDGFSLTVECRAAWSPSARFFAVADDSRGLSSPPLGAVINSAPFPDSVLRVRSGSGSGGDGLTWAGAFPTPESALQTATRTGGVVTEVWIAAGTYPAALNVTQPVRVLGGFAGVEVSASARDWTANPVILTGEALRRVIDVSSSVASFTLDGVTVTAGSADSGAGVRSGALAATVAHCVFRSNVSTGAGGAALHLVNPGSGTRIVNCLFDANTASGIGRGGAVLIDSAPSGVLVANCTIVSNATGSGGAVHIGAGSLTVANTIVAFNSAGVFATAAASAALNNCNVFSNASGDTAGTVTQVDPVAGDPLFVNAAAGDYRLSAGSPCLDRGTTSQPPVEFTLDLAHQPRRTDADATGGAVPDVGAFESACAAPPCTGDLNGDSTVNTADLLTFLGAFGGPGGGSSDLNNDGAVNTADLVIFLGRFGSVCARCTP